MLNKCHPEYNNWKFYWSRIAGINYFPVITEVLIAAYILR